MNYKLMARILLRKDNSRFGASVIKKLNYTDIKELIYKLDDLDFLKEVRYELEKEVDNPDAQKIIKLISKRLDDLMIEDLKNRLLN